MIMTDNEYNRIRKEAADALVHWTKTGWGYYTMRDAVSRFMEANGGNSPSIGGEETILARRKIAISRLAIDCIYALSKSELAKLDRELEVIANDIPKVNKTVRR